MSNIVPSSIVTVLVDALELAKTSLLIDRTIASIQFRISDQHRVVWAKFEQVEVLSQSVLQDGVWLRTGDDELLLLEQSLTFSHQCAWNTADAAFEQVLEFLLRVFENSPKLSVFIYHNLYSGVQVPVLLMGCLITH